MAENFYDVHIVKIQITKFLKVPNKEEDYEKY